MYFTPSSISFVALLVLGGALTGYLGWLWITQRSHGVPLHLTSLTLTYLLTTVFVGQLFIEVSLLPAERLQVVFLENTTVALLIFFFIRFAYHFPSPDRFSAWERRGVLGLGLVYVVFEVSYAVYRFWMIYVGQDVLYRLAWMELFPAAGFLWLLVVLARQAYAAKPGESWQAREGRSAWWMAAFSTLLVGVVLFNFLSAFRVVPAFLRQLMLSSGITLVMVGVFLAYINVYRGQVSLVIKFSVAGLVVVLPFLGVTGWMMLPSLEDNYAPVLFSEQSFSFRPIGKGGYEMTEVPYTFIPNQDSDRLVLFDTSTENNGVLIHYPFPFFGKIQNDLYVMDDGAVGIAHPFEPSDLQFHYGYTSGIVPLYLDLSPGQPVGGVFVDQEENRLVITWLDVPSRSQPEARFTFQLALYRDGRFEINYGKKPDNVNYGISKRPESMPYIAGILCGDWQVCGLPYRVSPGSGKTWMTGPVTSGYVIDFYKTFRSKFHGLLVWPFFGVFLASWSALIGMPLLTRFLVDQPIKKLLQATGELTRNAWNGPIAAETNDEFAILTQAVNELGEMVSRKAFVPEPEFERSNQDDADLTSRQLEIMGFLADGLTYKEIAVRMHISERSVKYEMSKIVKLLNLENRHQAAIYSRRLRSN